MTEKTSFVLYLEYGEYFDELTDAQAGKVIKAIFAFESGQELPDITGAAKITFSAIRNQLIRDYERWKKQVENGKRGGRPSQKAQKDKADSPSKTQSKPNQNPDEASMNHELGIKSHESSRQIPPTVPPGGTAAADGEEPAGFLDFWTAYPRKSGKKAALRAWQNLDPPAPLQEKIQNALRRQKASGQWLRENGRYIPLPATWLNQGRWEDELPGGDSDGPDFSRWELPD